MESVRCELKYSRGGAAFIVAAALATGTIAALLPWSGPLRAALEGLIAAHAALALERLAAVRAIRASVDGHVRIERRDGSAREGELAAGGFVAPWLVCLRWRPHGARLDRALLVLPGMLSVEEFRRLRVILRSA